MNGSYINQAEIDKVQEMLYNISPLLRISCYELSSNYANAVRVSFPVKDNSKIIQRLENVGFRKWRKYKVEASSIWSENADYSFWIEMRLHLPEPPKEV